MGFSVLEFAHIPTAEDEKCGATHATYWGGELICFC